MSDKVLIKELVGDLDIILINVIKEQSELNQRQFIASIYAIFARFNLARVYDSADLTSIWNILRSNKNTLTIIERIIMQWRLSAFNEDKDVDRLVALMATSLTENNKDNSVIDDGYLEAIPSHSKLEALYRGNFWYIVLYMSSMCPNFKDIITGVSREK